MPGDPEGPAQGLGGAEQLRGGGPDLPGAWPAFAAGWSAAYEDALGYLLWS